MNLGLKRSLYCWRVCFCLTRPLWEFEPGLVVPALFPPPVPLKLIGGLGFSFTGFSAGGFFPADPEGFPADPDDAVVLAVSCSTACKFLALAAEAVAGPAVLPMGTLAFGAFSGVECLTLNVLFCCARPLTPIPTNTTTTANENLIFFLDPLLRSPAVTHAPELRDTYR